MPAPIDLTGFGGTLPHQLAGCSSARGWSNSSRPPASARAASALIAAFSGAREYGFSPALCCASSRMWRLAPGWCRTARGAKGGASIRHAQGATHA